MARARRRQGKGDEAEKKPSVRASPEVCPICAVRPDEDMSTHLQSHAPKDGCPHCGTAHTGWKVDWDSLQYPTQQGLFFYCNPCGKYRPLEVSSQD
jgi:hypothetical protein